MKKKILQTFFSQDFFATQRVQDNLLIEFCKLRLTPTEIIQEYNKKTEGEKLLNTNDTRRKISQIKYVQKPEDVPQKICNIRDLRELLERKCVKSLTNTHLSSIPWNEVIISDYEIRNNEFVAYATTKNLQLNIVKQLATGKMVKGADGTYKLNDQGHPMIVIGVYDLHGKFHPSKKFYSQFY